MSAEHGTDTHPQPDRAIVSHRPRSALRDEVPASSRALRETTSDRPG